MSRGVRPNAERIFAAVLGLLYCGATESLGQDAHYWTLQYGPRSSLLGGAVIGSVDDVSGTYYNPGALVLASELAFAVSADVFEFSVVTLEDGAGEGVDLGTARSGLRPSLLAGTITKDIFGSGVLAYSALTRARGEQDLEGLIALSGGDTPPDVDLADFAALGRFEGNFDEFWGAHLLAPARLAPWPRGHLVRGIAKPTAARGDRVAGRRS